MDTKKFSLDYIQPAASSGSIEESNAASDPWARAVQFYSKPILGVLQTSGRKTVNELLQITKDETTVQDLQLDQFLEILYRLAEANQVTVTKVGETAADQIVALPIKRR
jgi:hypothetical protein